MGSDDSERRPGSPDEPERRATEPPVPEREAPAEPAQQPQPSAPVATASGRFAAWWSRPATVLSVLLVIALLLTLTVVLGTAALRGDPEPRDEAGADPTADASPTRTPARWSAAPPAPPSPGIDAVPPVDPDDLGIPYTSGALTANDGTYLDFDGNSRTGRWTDDSDVAVEEFGITGLDAVPLRVLALDVDPTRLDCASVPAQDWQLTVPTEDLTEGTRVCFVTGEQRYGYFVVMRTRLAESGALIGLELAYVVWEGSEDGEDA